MVGTSTLLQRRQVGAEKVILVRNPVEMEGRFRKTDQKIRNQTIHEADSIRGRLKEGHQATR